MQTSAPYASARVRLIHYWLRLLFISFLRRYFHFRHYFSCWYHFAELLYCHCHCRCHFEIDEVSIDFRFLPPFISAGLMLIFISWCHYYWAYASAYYLLRHYRLSPPWCRHISLFWYFLSFHAAIGFFWLSTFSAAISSRHWFSTLPRHAMTFSIHYSWHLFIFAAYWLRHYFIMLIDAISCRRHAIDDDARLRFIYADGLASRDITLLILAIELMPLAIGYDARYITLLIYYIWHYWHWLFINIISLLPLSLLAALLSAARCLRLTLMPRLAFIMPLICIYWWPFRWLYRITFITFSHCHY